MRAISIRQPHAASLLLGNPVAHIERVEIDELPAVGNVLIRAGGNTDTIANFDEACRFLEQASVPAFCVLLPQLVTKRVKGVERYRPSPIMPLGGIIGRARIVGHIYDGAVHVPGKRPTPVDAELGRWWAGSFALLLADATPTPFVPCIGARGIYRVDDETIEALAAAEERRGAAE